MGGQGQNLEEAERLLSLGNAGEAEALFREAAEKDALASRAREGWGRALEAQDRLEEAAAQYQKAARLRPDFWQASLAAGRLLEQLGRAPEAVAWYRKVLRYQAESEEAQSRLKALEPEGRATVARAAGGWERWFRQGASLHKQGRYAEAAQAWRASIAEGAGSEAGAWGNLGWSLWECGLYQEAEEAFGEACRLRPAIGEWLQGRGAALMALSRFREASAVYEQALAAGLDTSECWFGLAAAREAARDFAGAAEAYLRAAALDAGNLDITLSASRALRKGERYDDALALLELWRARAGDSEAWLIERGLALEESGALESAMGHYQAAVAAMPRSAALLNGIGTTLYRMRRMNEAVEIYRRAIDLDAEYAAARINRAICLLQSGDFAAGWPEFEWRLRKPELNRPRTDATTWDGGPMHGQTLRVYQEQGLGDTIQCVRFLRDAKRLSGAKILLECSAKLHALLRRCDGVDEIVVSSPDAGATPDLCDFAISLMSLAHRLRATPETVGASVPYLAPSEEARSRWSGLSLSPNEINVGIVWAGDPAHPDDRNRSCAAADFLPLAQVPGVRLFSLQVGYAVSQLHTSGLDRYVTDLSERVLPFDDTAAVIERLDLVIAVDTAVAHLAGAMGRPVWTLLPYLPDWRWLFQRDDSVWYPTMRVFRQSQPRRWDDVLLRVSDALETGCFQSPVYGINVAHNAGSAT